MKRDVKRGTQRVMPPLGDGAPLTGWGLGHLPWSTFPSELRAFPSELRALSEWAGCGPGSPGNSPPPSLPHHPLSLPLPCITASHPEPQGYLFKMRVPRLLPPG